MIPIQTKLMQIDLAFTLILHGHAVHMCLSSENSSPDRFVLQFQRQINITWIEMDELAGQGRKSVNARSMEIKFVWIGMVSSYV